MVTFSHVTHLKNCLQCFFLSCLNFFLFLSKMVAVFSLCPQKVAKVYIAAEDETDQKCAVSLRIYNDETSLRMS